MRLEYLSHLAELGEAHLHPFGRRATGHLIQALELQPGQRVLEIGCGTGGTIVRVAPSHRVHVFGVDILPSMLHVARARLSLVHLRGVHLCLATGAALPFADGIYSRVYMESVLGFQSATVVGSMLSETFRVLEPGGRWAATEAVWKRSVSEQQAAAIHSACLRDFGLCQASELPWHVDDWLRLMRAAGFIVVAADLLQERLPAPETKGVSWREALSELLSRYYRFRAHLRPIVVRRKLEYRERLHQHREDGRHIETRLFLLAKP